MLEPIDFIQHSDGYHHLIGVELPYTDEVPVSIGTASTGISQFTARADHIHGLTADSFIAPIWTALALNIGWTNFGGTPEVARYTLVNKYTVAVEGLIVGAAGRATNVVGTLPAGLRPHAIITYSGAASVGGVLVPDYINVKPNGDIELANQTLAAATAFATIACTFVIG